MEPGVLSGSLGAKVGRIAERYGVPGLVLAIARGGAPPEIVVIGEGDAGNPLSADSLFPVASITKLATALAVLRLVDQGRLALDARLGAVVPDAAASDVTLRMLLSHSSGLPDDVAPGLAPYRIGLDWTAIRQASLVTKPVRPPNTRIVYSNVGISLLAAAIERVTGLVIREAPDDLVLGPLGIEGYLGIEPPRRPATITGDLGEHTGTPLEPINSVFWRSLALPYAGLVTTVSGALQLALAFAGQPAGFLSPALLAQAVTDQNAGLAGEMIGLFDWPQVAWGLGVELHGTKTPHWVPAEAAAESFGHAGATGCLTWVDPSRDLAWAFLSRRSLFEWWPGFAEIGAAVVAANDDPAAAAPSRSGDRSYR